MRFTRALRRKAKVEHLHAVISRSDVIRPISVGIGPDIKFSSFERGSELVRAECRSREAKLLDHTYQERCIGGLSIDQVPTVTLQINCFALQRK